NRVPGLWCVNRLFSLLALVLLLGIGAELASADTFYLATSPPRPESPVIGAPVIGTGSLYLVNPTTAATTLIGPLVDTLGNGYGMTGMAFQPGTNVLYGATSANSPTAPSHLVTIDRTTALVTDIGSFGLGSGTMADITFDRTTGILYGAHSNGDGWLYTINLATGAATKVGTGTRVNIGGDG